MQMGESSLLFLSVQNAGLDVNIVPYMRSEYPYTLVCRTRILTPSNWAQQEFCTDGKRRMGEGEEVGYVRARASASKKVPRSSFQSKPG